MYSLLVMAVDYAKLVVVNFTMDKDEETAATICRRMHCVQKVDPHHLQVSINRNCYLGGLMLQDRVVVLGCSDRPAY